MAEEETSDSKFNPLPDDAPDDVRDFITTNDVGDRYQVILKQILGEGVKPAYIRSWANRVPSINLIGEEWGPGDYQICFSYSAEQPNGTKKSTMKNFPLHLPERAWREVHEAYKDKRSRELAAEKARRLGEKIEDAKVAQAIGIQPSGVSELDTLTKAMETLKRLGVPIMGGTSQPTEKKPSFGETLVAMAPVIAALSPILIALIGKKSEDNSGLLQIVITKMLEQKPQSESDSMKQAMAMIMGLVPQLLDMKQSMQPAEKESFMEKVFDKITAALPQIMELAKLSKVEQERNFMVNMARNSNDMRTVKNDPELLADLVLKFDKAYGFQQTERILSVAGLMRPGHMAEAYREYPSPGFRRDGQAGAEDVEAEEADTGTGGETET